MKNTKGLPPGVHFMQGDRLIKSLSLNDYGAWESAFGGGGRTQTAERLLSAVGWVFIAIDYRREQIINIPYEWQRDGEQADPPFEFDTRNLIYRIDPALQLAQAAYLLKLRRGRKFVGVRWIDPTAVRPMPESLTSDGYTQFTYQTQFGQKDIPAEDIIRFIIPGQREHDAGVTAGQATSLAAQILLGMNETSDTFYDTNGLPVVAVIVPEGTMAEDVETVKTKFERIFKRNRSRKGNKTIGLREGTKIETISFMPKDLAMSELELAKREEILLAHRVPPAIVYSDVNSNQARDKMQQFVSVMGSRLQMIADIINADEDIKATGYELVVRVQDHWAMKRDEAVAALGFTRYLQGMYPEAAAHLMGISEEDFPEEMRGHIFLPAAIRSKSSPPQTGDIVDGGVEGEAANADIKSVELTRLRRFVKKGTHKKRPFHSDILTKAEIDAVINGGAIRLDAPFQGYP